MEPTAQSPHVVESVPGLDELSDEVTVRVFARAPFESHRVITAVCRRLRSLLSSPAFREARLESGYAEHGVVVAGGVFADGRTTDECWLLSISSGRWSRIAPLSGARRLACSAILENQDDNGQPEMWALGGWCDGNDLATVEVWNPRTNVWRESAPLSRTRSSAVAGVVGGCCLVVAGGFADDHCMRPAEVVVPIGSGPVPPLPYATSSAASCVLRGRLYVMGGWENTKLQVLQKSDEAVFTWTLGSDLPDARWDAAIVVHEGRLWLIGGIVDYSPSASVVIYDADDDAWYPGPALPSAISGICATAFNGEIYVICGAGTVVYRNHAWVETAIIPGDMIPAQAHAQCQSVLLG